MKFSKLLPDIPFPQPVLSKTFQEHHERYLELFPEWSLLATRRKLVATYWLKILVNHFLFLLVCGSLIVFLFNKGQSLNQLIVSLMPASLVVFLTLFLTMYWPLYQLEFLPHLDSCIESFNIKKLEGVQRCKKEQYSVLSLMLIQHTYQHMAGIKNGLIDTTYAKLVAQQYGVSIKSIVPALQTTIRGQWDRKSIRKRTEITNDFENAKNYFMQLSCDKAIQLLDRLQQKILQESTQTV